jgi:branched-chain amino acid transport system substrate-binding protein
MRTVRSVVAAACCMLAVACAPQEPIRIGFIGGLSDRDADNGRSGQEGVILAVEQFNRSGGLGGRKVEIVSRDDAQNREVAARSASELVAAKVEAVIGPFTSSMAEVIVPITRKAGIFEISPTITSMAFYGRDDNLFRINRNTRDNARDYATVMADRAMRQVAVAYDMRNRSFAESWLAEFGAAAAGPGLAIAVAVAYESGPDADFELVVRHMLAARPDSLLFIAGPLDVPRLAQQARRLAPSVPIVASEWAASEQLAELGGDVVDGLLIAQTHDRDDASPRYRAFADAYFERFQRAPGFSSVLAYDAATVVLTALGKRRDGQTLKAAVLANGPYEGLQHSIQFDANGDTQRRVFFTEIRGGRYVRLANRTSP